MHLKQWMTRDEPRHGATIEFRRLEMPRSFPQRWPDQDIDESGAKTDVIQLADLWTRSSNVRCSGATWSTQLSSLWKGSS